MLSIVIPSYNQGAFLEEALLSAVSQKTSEVEVLVMDGGSTDGSCEVIRKYEKELSYWQSAQDKGQSDAINQGFRKARGAYVTWLNSDDVLLAGAVASILGAVKRYPECHWFLGNVLWMNKSGEIIRAGKVEKECWFWNKRYLFSNGGPSAVMRRQTLLDIGALREDFHYMMDTELWCRFLSQGYPFRRIGHYLWGLRLHEQAKMSGHNFANSSFADKSHPSWQQKRLEVERIAALYPKGKLESRLWRFSKILSSTAFSRVFDKRLIGKNYHILGKQ